jgi:hypothetical protein
MQLKIKTYYLCYLFLFRLLNKLPADMEDIGPLKHLVTETILGHSIQFVFPKCHFLMIHFNIICTVTAVTISTFFLHMFIYM